MKPLFRCFLLFILLVPSFSLAQPVFSVTFDKTLQPDDFSERVYVLLSSDLEKEPRTNRGWYSTPPMYAVDVSGHDTRLPVLVDSSALFFPTALRELPSGTYLVQAVARRSLDGANPGRSEGDLYSVPKAIFLANGANLTIPLHLDQIVPPRPFEETARIRLVEMVSPLMSAFHGRPYIVRAGVSLPASWTESGSETYPVLYSVTGFGGSHHGVARTADRLGDAGQQMIVVVPDASNYRGHSAFADSENNGPWGRMLTEEMIPYIQKTYRGAGPEHRYVTGGSSGGWSSLWLQVTYPDDFNGVWSIVPDPVDFHDFQQIDLYAPGANMYRDPDGNRRPLARRDGNVTLWYDDFIGMETLLGPGGQIHSFEAVFSRKGPDGNPEPLFDRKTGDVNPDVARSWLRYDIEHILRSQWNTLGPKLAGKLRIYAGEVDNYYLEGAVRRLKDTLNELGSDADVRVFDGVGHATPPGVLDAMSEKILSNFRTRVGS